MMRSRTSTGSEVCRGRTAMGRRTSGQRSGSFVLAYARRVADVRRRDCSTDGATMAHRRTREGRSSRSWIGGWKLMVSGFHR